MHWRAERWRDYWVHRKVFRGLDDIAAFKEACYAPEIVDAPVALHVKSLPDAPLWCRPGTSDARVLWDTFYHQYHLPPKRMPRARCIVDLGANVGYTAAHFAQRYPDARIIAVEMDGDNARMCAQNLAPFGKRCDLIRTAVWSEDGELHYGGEASWSFRVSQVSDGADAGARTTSATCLKSLFDQLGIETVDYLKMDIEGAEDAVLRDPKPWIGRVRSMKIELHPPADYATCERILTACGFRCRRDGDHPNCLVAQQRTSFRRGNG